jgi:hypothetical protein
MLAELVSNILFSQKRYAHVANVSNASNVVDAISLEG